MIENDPGRTDIPAVLEGLWWGASGGRDAQFMVTNMSNLRASADVFLDFSGTRHPSVELDFRPHETKTVSITQLLSGLNVSTATAPEGGITIIQRQLQPTLIAQGKVLDPATGFSTTLSFPDPSRERANSLHASGVAIGTPTKDSPFAHTGYFIPHVVVRNLSGSAQTASASLHLLNMVRHCAIPASARNRWLDCRWGRPTSADRSRMNGAFCQFDELTH